MEKTSFGSFIEHGLRDEIKRMNNPNCVDCNECCSMGAYLTDEEYHVLKRFLHKEPYGKHLYQMAVAKINRHLDRGTVYWVCPFTSDVKRCLIYDIRPTICRNFHCDDPNCQDTRDLMIGSHTIADLFKRDTFERR